MTIAAELAARLAGARWIGAAGSIHGYDSIGSTNDEAMARGRAGAPHGTVIWADAQTRGRGRQGRVWHSPVGENVYLSVLLRLPLAPMGAPPLTLAAGVAACDAITAMGVQGHLKWPNDVLLGEGSPRKVAGILTETSTRGDKLEHVVIGIGVNVNTRDFPEELAPIATSIALECGRRVDRLDLVAGLLLELERRVDELVAGGPAPIVDAWKQRSRMLGRRLRVASGGQLVDGVARDIDREGALWLDADDGRELRVLSGEVVAHG